MVSAWPWAVAEVALDLHVSFSANSRWEHGVVSSNSTQMWKWFFPVRVGGGLGSKFVGGVGGDVEIKRLSGGECWGD